MTFEEKWTKSVQNILLFFGQIQEVVLLISRLQRKGFPILMIDQQIDDQRIGNQNNDFRYVFKKDFLIKIHFDIY